ncbi:MAG: glycosyltransferase family 117 protein [Gemmatimonadaceae bacterium]
MTAANTRSISRAPASRKVAPDSHSAYEPSYKGAAIAAIAVFALYYLTLSPSAWMWDTGEYMAAAKVLGLPHPPGNPFFMLVAHVFGELPLPGSYAQRINTMAALASALSAGFWFLITERILSGWLPKSWQRYVGAGLATLIGATAFTVWNQSVVNEKVYTISLFFFAAVSWLMISWADDPDGPKAERRLVLVAFLLGLGYSNHPAGFLPIPAVAVVILMRRWQTFLNWRLLVKSLLVIAIGLTPFIYEPIRAAHFPPINEGEPTACLEKFEWDCTLSELTRKRLMDNINREQYGKKLERGAPYTAQVGMWWLYFKWQWLRDAYNEQPALQAILAVLFLSLGLIGGYVHWANERRTFLYFGPLMFTLTLALIYYMNFKYGWSQAPELGDSVQREVRDRDYFYIWSFSAWGVWAAIGLVYVWQSVAQILDRTDDQPLDKAGYATKRSWLLATPLLLIACAPLAGNWSAASHRGDTFAADWGADMLNSVEPYAILITNGDNDTFPLWYAQEVEGVRQDVLVLVTSYLNTDWFVRQIIRNPVREYDAAKGPAMYRGREWPKPPGPPLAMTYQEADAQPDYVEIREPQLFRQRNITATIQPGYLTRDQIITLSLIKDAYPGRSVYFSTGGYHRSLGLSNYTLRQGLVEKLVENPIIPNKDTVQVGDGFLDIATSNTLWTEVYKGPSTLIKLGHWIDRPSFGIPYTYTVTGYVLAEALRAQGREPEAQKIMETVRDVAVAARITDVIAAINADR